MKLSDEQQLFVDEALKGGNILVDACIGSGKTTAIQRLCDEYPSDKKILYLTYNKLLKLDAKAKILGTNVTVTNYHGFAWACLARIGVRVGISDIIQSFNRIKPNTGHYDVLIIDEYQDIEQELAELLDFIKESNPGIQIVAVGDMEQKIYDKTTLDVRAFIDTFLGEKKVFEFTKCFRLSEEHAAMLGRVWNKRIVGVNSSCKVETMELKEICDFLLEQDPKDVLCLGARTGDMANTLNRLEHVCPQKYNKYTTYASIRDKDASNGQVDPGPENGIFTTFDSSKGLERKICVVFDFTGSYWTVRAGKPNQKYEILRNIFCVAASRGKEHIIFVHNKESLLTEEMLSAPTNSNPSLDNMNVSGMFDFKYKEDIEKCFSLLSCKKISLLEKDSVIDIKTNDGLIDLSPCIGIYQEQCFFDNYELEKELDLVYRTNKDKAKMFQREFYTGNTQQQILVLTALDTGLNRYVNQVETPFVSDADTKLIRMRLSTMFAPDDETQKECSITFRYGVNGNRSFEALGLIDVYKNDVVYELKFVSALTHEHFLQCACYVVATGAKKGVLWNTRDNTMYEITVKNKDEFLDTVATTITKGEYNARWSVKKQKNKKPKKRRFTSSELALGEILGTKAAEDIVRDGTTDITCPICKGMPEIVSRNSGLLSISCKCGCVKGEIYY